MHESILYLNGYAVELILIINGRQFAGNIRVPCSGSNLQSRLEKAWLRSTIGLLSRPTRRKWLVDWHNNVYRSWYTAGRLQERKRWLLLVLSSRLWSGRLSNDCPFYVSLYVECSNWELYLCQTWLGVTSAFLLFRVVHPVSPLTTSVRSTWVLFEQHK